jgi:hypothetical protein
VVKSSRCLAMDLETQSSVEAIEAFMDDPCFEIDYQVSAIFMVNFSIVA